MTYDEAKAIVAKKHRIGSTLTIGYNVTYFNEASALMVRENLNLNAYPFFIFKGSKYWCGQITEETKRVFNINFNGGVQGLTQDDVISKMYSLIHVLQTTTYPTSEEINNWSREKAIQEMKEHFNKTKTMDEQTLTKLKQKRRKINHEITDFFSRLNISNSEQTSIVNKIKIAGHLMYLINREQTLTVWAFLYSSCIHESGSETISLHFSKEDAEKAMNEHREKELAEFNEIFAKENPSDIKFGEHEFWGVKAIDII